MVQILDLHIGFYLDVFLKNVTQFSENEGEGQRPFGIFPKIHCFGSLTHSLQANKSFLCLGDSHLESYSCKSVSFALCKNCLMSYFFVFFTLTPSTSFSPSALPARLGLSTKQSFKWLIMSSLAIKIQCKVLTRSHLISTLALSQASFK